MENQRGNPLELEVFMRKSMGNQWNPCPGDSNISQDIPYFAWWNIRYQSQAFCHQSLVFGYMPKHDHIHWRFVLGAFSLPSTRWCLQFMKCRWRGSQGHHVQHKNGLITFW
jgi:hypothetical protein